MVQQQSSLNHSNKINLNGSGIATTQNANRIQI